MSDYGADSVPDLGETFDFMVTKSLLKEDNANVMQWTYPGYRVQKIARKIGRTNVHIKYKIE
jgi:hypothetical protein